MPQESKPNVCPQPSLNMGVVYTFKFPSHLPGSLGKTSENMRLLCWNVPLIMPLNSKAFEIILERKLGGRFKAHIWATILVPSNISHHSMHASVTSFSCCFSPSLVLLSPQWPPHLHSQARSPGDLSCSLQDPIMSQVWKRWKSSAFSWEGSVMVKGQPGGHRELGFYLSPAMC